MAAGHSTFWLPYMKKGGRSPGSGCGSVETCRKALRVSGREGTSGGGHVSGAMNLWQLYSFEIS